MESKIKKAECMWFFWEEKNIWKCILRDSYTNYFWNDPHYCGRGETTEKAFKDLVYKIDNHILDFCPIEKEKLAQISNEVNKRIKEAICANKIPSQKDFDVFCNQIKEQVVEEFKNKPD